MADLPVQSAADPAEIKKVDKKSCTDGISHFYLSQSRATMTADGTTGRPKCGGVISDKGEIK